MSYLKVARRCKTTRATECEVMLLLVQWCEHGTCALASCVGLAPVIHTRGAWPCKWPCVVPVCCALLYGVAVTSIEFASLGALHQGGYP